MAKAKEDKGVVSPEGLGALAASNADGAGLAAKTPCEELRDHEIIIHEIVVTPSDQVQWRLFLCNTPARALLTISDAMGHKGTLVNQTVPPPNPLLRAVMPPAPPLGRYVLIWSIFPTGPDWQTVAEVLVNGVVVFRQFKGAKSAVAIPRGFLFMEVQ